MKKKIAIVTPYYYPFIGGVETITKQLAIGLSGSGYDVSIITSTRNNSGSDLPSGTVMESGITIVRLATRTLSRNYGMNQPIVMVGVSKAIKQVRPDIIQIQSFPTWEFFNLAVLRRFTVPIVLVPHVGEDFIKLYTRGWKSLEAILLRRGIKRLSKVISVTEQESRGLREVLKSESNLIHNGIPLRDFVPKRAKEVRTILFAGRIVPQKRVHDLVQAYSMLSPALQKSSRMLIVGPTGDKAYVNGILRMISDLELGEYITFDTPRTKGELLEHYHSSAIFVLPTKGELFGLSIIEALASHNIVISTDTEGPRQLIQHGENGFLYNPENVNQLAELLEYCLTLSNPQRDRIVQTGLKTIEKFDAEVMLQKYRQVYEELLHK